MGLPSSTEAHTYKKHESIGKSTDTHTKEHINTHADADIHTGDTALNMNFTIQGKNVKFSENKV